MATNTHKGIVYGAGISYKGTAFNFTRDYYDTFADLEAEKSNWSIYFPKYFITNVGGTLYQYDGTNFNKFLTSGSNYASAEDLKNLQNTHAQDQQANESQLQEHTTNINELSKEATTSKKGLMSAADKSKINAIEAGAQVNTVTGVKGNSESSYRTGNINITPTNIGLGNVNNTSDADKPISTAQQVAIDEKVDKVDGKGLSTNDYTTDEKNKLAGITAGAQVNVIESVKVNGTAQAISNKEIDIPVPTKLSQLTNDIYEVATSAEITAILN